MARWFERYAVMEKRTFGEPACEIASYPALDSAQAKADEGVYRWVVQTWKEGGIWHWADEVLYRSFFWPGRQAYQNYPSPRRA